MTYTPQPGTIPARVVAYLATLPAGTQLSSAVMAETLGVDRNIMVTCLQRPARHNVVARDKRDGIVWWRLGGTVPLAVEPDDATDQSEPLPIIQRVIPAIQSDVAGLPPRPSWIPPVVEPQPEGTQAKKLARVAKVRMDVAPPALPPALYWVPPVRGGAPKASELCVEAVEPPAPPASPPLPLAAAPRKSSQKIRIPVFARAASLSPCDVAAAPSRDLRVALWSDGQLIIERGPESMRFDAREAKAILHYLSPMLERAA